MRLGGLPNLAASKTVGTAILFMFIGILWYVVRWTYNRIERPGQTVLPHLLAQFLRRSARSLDPAAQLVKRSLPHRLQSRLKTPETNSDH
jgi:hypothetical protein